MYFWSTQVCCESEVVSQLAYRSNLKTNRLKYYAIYDIYLTALMFSLCEGFEVATVEESMES